MFAGSAILQKPTWMPDNEHLVFVFHDAASDWNGQVGEIAIAAGKLHRITNDLNSYSNLTLAVTKDGKQLISIQLTPASLGIRDGFGRKCRRECYAHQQSWRNRSGMAARRTPGNHGLR